MLTAEKRDHIRAIRSALKLSAIDSETNIRRGGPNVRKENRGLAIPSRTIGELPLVHWPKRDVLSGERTYQGSLTVDQY